MKTENLIPTQWQLTTVKSINKGGVKKKHSRESKRDISGEHSFKNIWKCINNAKWQKNENMSQMQTAGRKQRLTVHNLIILNSTIENQTQNENKTYLFFADAKNVFINCGWKIV